MILAITGGTGFVGSHLIDHALETGHTIRALARKPQAKRIGVTWIEGALDRPKSLATLVEGADVVIHVAGVVNAADRAGFAEGNIAGTQAIVAATRSAGIRRFVQVSSLAARAPALSNYGWSKAEAETCVAASGLDWTIVRPPAIFGPRDHDLLDVFKAARSGYVPMPPAGTRVSLLYVEDLTALLLALAEHGTGRRYAQGLGQSRLRARDRRRGRQIGDAAVDAACRPVAGVGRRPSRPARQGQADARPGPLFLPPRLGLAHAAAGHALDALGPDPAGAGANRGVVSRGRAAIAPKSRRNSLSGLRRHPEGRA